MKKAFHEIVSETNLEETRLGMTLLDVLSLMRSPQSNFQNIAESLEFNPKAANTLLRKVNSPHFQLDNPIRKLPHAVSILGIRQLREMLLASTERNFYHQFLKVEPMMLEVKKHSIAVACYAEEMAKMLRQYYTVEFYKAALLHDIGKMALLVNLGEDYLKVMREAEEMNYSLYLHERDSFGFNHVDVGVEIAYAWNFDDACRHVIQYHHEITEQQLEDLPSRDTKMLQIISFANVMSHRGSSVTKNRSLYQNTSTELPLPPGDLSIQQLALIAEQAGSKARELYRCFGLQA